MDHRSVEASHYSWATLGPVDLFRCVLRRLPSVAVTAAVTTVIVAAVLWACPNRYASDGLFYARLGRGSVAVDPTLDASQTVSLQDSRSSEVNSISEMLNSREFADRVVKKVGVREINYPRTWIDRLADRTGAILSGVASSPAVSSSVMDRTEYDIQVAHEEAVNKVMKAVSIKVPKNSYTISVAAQVSDPMLAQKIVQAFMEEYGSYHVEAHKSAGSLGFFSEQTEASHRVAIEARRKLQRARTETGWISTASAEESLRERILNLQLSLDDARSKFADAKSQADSLASRLDAIDEWIPMETTKLANNAVDGMREQLYEVTLSDGEKLAKVTPSHPRYKILRDKLIQGEEIVNSKNEDREQVVEALNPLRLTLETAFQTALTTAEGHSSSIDSLEASLAETRSDLNRLNEDAVRLAELTWASEIAEKNYLSHSQSLESSRMIQDLDNQNMSDVSVIQNASLNLKKVGPPRMLLTLVGGLVGICLGIVQAIARESSPVTPVANPKSVPISKVSPMPIPSSKGRSKSIGSGFDEDVSDDQDQTQDDEFETPYVSTLPR